LIFWAFFPQNLYVAQILQIFHPNLIVGYLERIFLGAKFSFFQKFEANL